VRKKDLGKLKKLYNINPLQCPKYKGEKEVIAFTTDFSDIYRIINHLII